MLAQFAKRLGFALISLAGLLVAVFFLARLTGNPTSLYLPIDASLEMRAEFEARHGYDRPLIEQFFKYAGEVLRGDFGDSLYQGRPALDAALQAFPTTLSLALVTLAIAMVLAVIIGALAAMKPGGGFDRVATIISLLGASAPSFWVAIVGILVFAVGLRMLPTSGYGGPVYWILPIAVLVLRPLGLLIQVIRGSMITALTSDFTKMARAKGATASRVAFVHALRTALIPAVTVAGIQISGIVNGAIIVETIFAFPGIGKLMLDSVLNRDFAVLQASVMVTAVAIFVLNIAIDFIYAALDPRIRYA